MAPAAAGNNGPTFVVTGGTGFLGQHVVRQLLARGCHVRLLCRSPASAASLFPVDPPTASASFAADVPHPGAIQVVQGSVEDSASLGALFEGVGRPEGPPVAGVFHLAGLVEHSQRRAAEVEVANVTGTLNVLSAACSAGVRRVVYASTSGTVAVSEDSSFVGTDDSPYAESITQSWPYYRTKIEAEKRAREWAGKHGLELICMRPTLLLGPGDSRLSSCRTVADLLARKIPFLPSGGLSFVDVRDTAAAFIRAMEAGSAGATYLLGARNLSLQEFFKEVERVSGVPAPTLRAPAAVSWALAAAVSSLLGLLGRWNPSLDPVLVEMSHHYWYLDSRKAQDELGFRPRDPNETLRDTVAWLRDHQNLP